LLHRSFGRERTVIEEVERSATPAQRQALMLARQEIESLRRWYAVATDKLGLADDEAACSEGLRIYHRIFAPQARIRVSGPGARPLGGTGPDAWAEVVSNALGEYEATQHLIGSQVVNFDAVDFGADPAVIAAGSAHMSSYVQAWHTWQDGRLRLVLGTYLDTVVFQPAVGWQIDTMNLVYTSGEERALGSTS
jgi:hypothetical protein